MAASEQLPAMDWAYPFWQRTHSRSWSRASKGFLGFLLDGSISMTGRMRFRERTHTKAHIATTTVNQLLHRIAMKAPIDRTTARRKDWCDFVVYRYGDAVASVLTTDGSPCSLPDLVALAHPEGQVQLANGATESQKSWVNYFASSPRTEMAMAIDRLCEVVAEWVMRHEDSCAPLCIHVSDGLNNPANPADDPIAAAQHLFQLGTSDGNALLFNCHISETTHARLAFPSDIGQIRALGLPDEERAAAELLFTISSVVPVAMAERAAMYYDRQLEPGARGFMFNADALDLVRFISWGSQTGENADRLATAVHQHL